MRRSPVDSVSRPLQRRRLAARDHRKALRPRPCQRGQLSGVPRVFDEQVYRIDHYLGKETVQNILAFRFGNGIFEPLWNRRYIDHIQITAAESIGVEGRGAYYQEAGALRDMIQNHLLQVMATVAMEPCATFSPDAVRDERAKLLRSIHIMKPEEVEQYRSRDSTAGRIGGEESRLPQEPASIRTPKPTPTPPAPSSSTTGAGRACRFHSHGQEAAQARHRHRHPVQPPPWPLFAGRGDGEQKTPRPIC